MRTLPCSPSYNFMHFSHVKMFWTFFDSFWVFKNYVIQNGINPNCKKISQYMYGNVLSKNMK